MCIFVTELIFIQEFNTCRVMENKENKKESSKIRINEHLEMDINDMLVINSLNELGDFVTSEDFCKSLDEIFDGK